jgi:hypothetical protein
MLNNDFTFDLRKYRIALRNESFPQSKILDQFISDAIWRPIEQIYDALPDDAKRSPAGLAALKNLLLFKDLFPAPIPSA